jgi:CDGSH iron-sulfur domain-containing protein 3
MSTPADQVVVAAKAGIALDLEPGEYWYCTCGRSKAQPWCDGSHAGTPFAPQAVQISEKGQYWLCACKHTANAPFCDGAHELLD